MLKLFDHTQDKPKPAFVIAEVAQAHDGSLGMAHAYIDAAAEAGADAIKFQTHIAAAESTQDEKFRVRFSRQDATRYDYWKRMEFTLDQWEGLRDHAFEKGLIFLSSPFSVLAVEWLESLDVEAWKIGSGETVSADILDAVLQTGKPILLSTGMSSYAEIDTLVESFRKKFVPFCLFQCTSSYPVALSDVGLNVLEEFQKRYACPVGLSDHSGTVYPSLAAMARGCQFIEAHITFDKRLFGPDVSSSLTVEELRLVCRARDAFYVMDSHTLNKDDMARSLSGMRTMFGKSLAPIRDLPAGTVLEESMLSLKKPGGGIPGDEKSSLTGKVLKRNVFANRLLSREDLDA